MDIPVTSMANILSFMLFHATFYASLIFHADCLSAIKQQDKVEAWWTWIGGSNHGNQHSTLNGSQSYPGSRHGATTWFGSNATVWVFGGKGFGLKESSALPQMPSLDELWSLDIKGRHWSFHPFDSKTGSTEKPPLCFGCVSCSYKNKAVVFGSSGSFIFEMGTMKWSALGNNKSSPHPRSHASFWCDTKKGMLWIFGGAASDKNLNDFWNFSFKDLQWKEIKPQNNKSVIPAKCSKAATWMQPSGPLYMFGGSCDGQLTSYFWSFSPETLKWKKLGGSEGVTKCAGKYGKRGVASKNNHPGCRVSAASWVDKHNNLWMFGGSGFDNFSVTTFSMPGLLSDFWMYNTSSNQWVWTGGLSRGEGAPFFGKKGKADPRNVPGPRENAVSFSYNNQFWLFGGGGHDVKQRDGILNDLWMYGQVKIYVTTTEAPTLGTDMPGDTISISFGLRVVIALLILTLGLVVSLSMCYSKECKIFRFKQHLRPVVKYKPVKVEMMQVPQPEIDAPLSVDPNRNL